MDPTQGFVEVALGESVTVRVDAPPHGDVIFLPSDSRGTPGELNSGMLQRLGLPTVFPTAAQLAPGYFLQSMSVGLICWIVTVGRLSPIKALKRHLVKALSVTELQTVHEIWLPLMGTGSGGLGHDQSFTLILEALRESEWLDLPGRHATISLPPNLTGEAIAALTVVIAAARADISGQPVDDDGPWSGGYFHSKSPGVDSALLLAAELSRQAPPPRQISSELLFFALAEAQSAAAPKALAADPAADLFAMAVQDLAGDRYAGAWQDYFGTTERLNLPPEPQILPPPTPNIEAILLAAAATAKTNGAAQITTDHMIHALLTRQQTQLRGVLEGMGVAPEMLLAEYANARLGQINMKFRNDVATDTDRLGYARYAHAISEFLTHAETPPPLSISIQAPWGGGKSSLMNLVREKLDPKDIREKHKPKIGVPAIGGHLALGSVLRFLDRRESFKPTPDLEMPDPETPDPERSRLWTVWFNAWKYETSEQIWAGLVDAIVSQIGDRLPLLEREKFFLKLQLARIDDGIVRKKIYDRVITIWWSKVRVWLLSGLGLLASLVGIRAAAPLLLTDVPDALLLASDSGTVAVPIVLSAFMIGTYFANRAAVRKEPATFSLAEYIRVPDYDKAVGQIHQIHADLRRVLEIVPTDPGATDHAPIVIFIDDLDRCSPGKVASVVEGVSMLLASDTYRCMFVIGMDPQMVAAALEKAHEDVRKQLPRYERTVPLGWRFMDKFIQLPFTIPPTAGDRFDTYIDWLSDTAEPPSSPQPTPPPPPHDEPVVEPGPDPVRNSRERAGPGTKPPPSPEPAPTSFSESRDVGAIVRAITRGQVGNPREMKRMVNLARFYLALRAARRADDGAWRAPSPAQYARWIAVTLRWPDMMRWLQWGADEATWNATGPSGNLIVRRLHKLEQAGQTATDLQGWKDALKTDLMVPIEHDSDWACDPKLFEFFKAESSIANAQRLSAAAAREFW